MASSEPGSYAEALGAVDGAKADANRARLVDPGEHFPYKRDVALAALDTEDGENYTSAEIVDATAAYVEAQQSHLEDPDDEGLAEQYRTAADDLVLARQFHRADRQGLQIVAGNSDQQAQT